VWRLFSALTVPRQFDNPDKHAYKRATQLPQTSDVWPGSSHYLPLPFPIERFFPYFFCETTLATTQNGQKHYCGMANEKEIKIHKTKPEKSNNNNNKIRETHNKHDMHLIYY
jgi:hypothetical protein